MPVTRLARAAFALVALSSIVAADSPPFTITVSSTNATLDGTHAYISDPLNSYASSLIFTADPSIPATVFTLDNAGGHFAAQLGDANPEVPVFWANIDSSNSYDANVLFSDPSNGFNWVLCHQYTNYISCAVTGEASVRLSKLYVCDRSEFGTIDSMGLKIGRVVPTEGCWGVQLNFTNVA